MLLATLGLAALGACDQRAEGEFDGPAGFSERENAASALAPAAFARDRGRLVTRGLAAAEHPAPGSSRTPVAALGAELAPHYDEGLRLVAPSAPDAFIEVQPVGGAAHAPARLRHDGALVAYDDAYPRVSAAVGASDDRVETKLRVAKAADAPALRYRLTTGPAFGH